MIARNFRKTQATPQKDLHQWEFGLPGGFRVVHNACSAVLQYNSNPDGYDKGQILAAEHLQLKRHRELRALCTSLEACLLVFSAYFFLFDFYWV